MNSFTQTHFSLACRNRKAEAIPYQDILYLEGSINYTLIHLINGKVKVSPRTMLYHIQHSLNDSFIRIHRAFCVNKCYIQADSDFSLDYIELKNGTQLAIARRRRKILQTI